MEQTIKTPGSIGEITAIAANLTAACFVAGCIIALVFVFTGPYAEKNREKASADAMKNLIPSAVSFTKVKDHESWLEARGLQGMQGYILDIKAKGYGGAIKILAAIDTAYGVVDFRLISHNETPGLGDGADKPKFRDCFKGKHAEQLYVVKTHDPDKIDAMTGATITSNAVTNAIRQELQALQRYRTDTGKVKELNK